MTYHLEFPDGFEEVEFEVECKGYLDGVVVVTEASSYDVVVYEPTRLAEDTADEVSSDGYFAVPNLLVVPVVTRDAITRAVERLAVAGFAELVPRCR
ncbi:hypothetical protein [Kitasatospora sp. NPDC097643]|uniref:hypothetical protein n=1 Tax=Kitasatospora sp. NPDC097643 TaxID=3157230 RepID=UPI0033316ED2